MNANGFSDLRRRLARRVAQLHAPLSPWLGLVSGSTVEDVADARSDVDMSLVFEALPPESALRAACPAPWTWTLGDFAEGGAVVAFALDGIEIQIAYNNRATLEQELDQVLLKHDPDTPLHKLCEGIAKAEPLAGAEALVALQARIADYPPPLARALAAHWLGVKTTPWRAAAQIVHRDALPWCRELQAQATMRLLGALAGLNDLYFTDFQFKRLHAFERKLKIRPAGLAARLEAALSTPPGPGFDALHALEAEVTALALVRWPDLDLSAARSRHSAYAAHRA
jgi:hypothetical protein